MHTGRLGILLSICLLIVPAADAMAATVSYSDSAGPNLTDWNDSVDITLFDPSLGVLTGIQFDVTGSVEGEIFYENEENHPSPVHLELSAAINLLRPDNSLLVATLPAYVVDDNPTAYDGALDFDGTSGKTYSGLLAQDSQSTVSPPPVSDLALFTGLGTITLPVSAVGSSYGLGPGNWTFGFTTFAAADVTVTYTYTPVPEPATAVLAFSGLWGLFRRPRRR